VLSRQKIMLLDQKMQFESTLRLVQLSPQHRDTLLNLKTEEMLQLFKLPTKQQIQLLYLGETQRIQERLAFLRRLPRQPEQLHSEESQPVLRQPLPRQPVQGTPLPVSLEPLNLLEMSPRNQMSMLLSMSDAQLQQVPHLEVAFSQMQSLFPTLSASERPRLKLLLQRIFQVIRQQRSGRA
jgi:hypothetical protein